MKKKRTQKTQQQVVSAPLWLRRRMVRNLEQAAKNKVSPSRVECAKKVLQAVGKKEKPDHYNTPFVRKPKVAGIGVSTFHQN